MKKYVIGIMGFVLCLSAAAEMRIWTSVKGDTVEAEYIRDATGKVWIRPINGKTKAVPISALCEVDQIYILKQTPPKIEIKVDDDIDRSTVGSDIDNVREETRLSVEVNKVSKAPYPTEYEVHFFTIAWNLRKQEFYVADKLNETFRLDDSNGNSFGFSGKRLILEYDPDPPWGTQYEGYLVVVKMDDGKIVATKGKDKYLSRLDAMMKGTTRFDDDFNPM